MASSSIIALAGTLGALTLAMTRPTPALGHPPAPGVAGKTPASGDQRGSEPGKEPLKEPGEEIDAPPPTYQANGVTVDEHLGARVPLDAKFRTQDGTPITLGEALSGGLPAILTFNYSDCPMLCSVQLNGLTAALPAVGAFSASPERSESGTVAASSGESRKALFRVGAQFRIVTIDLEPTETLDKARAMRERYLARLPEDQRAAARRGWTFLVAATPGDAASIRRVADAVGFRYTYIQDRAEWAHPAALILLSATGVVTRYLYGIEFDPAVVRESIYKAGLAEPSAAVGFLLRCYHYDPDANSHVHAGVMALRIGAAAFAIVLFSALGMMHLARRSRSRDKTPAAPAAPNGVT